jgi:hypothetical protein
MCVVVVVVAPVSVTAGSACQAACSFAAWLLLPRLGSQVAYVFELLFVVSFGLSGKCHGIAWQMLCAQAGPGALWFEVIPLPESQSV